MTSISPAFNSKQVLNDVLDDDALVNKIKNAYILLIGGGGIGCEVIKNLILLGFDNITVVDLDTIDVSNLNRQFLFSKIHVGKSKAKTAANVAIERYAHPNENPKVIPIHNSIQSSEYDVNYFKTFSLVINALDNRAARSHVNRMCLAAKVPLIESGSEGYLGQVFSIKKSVSACYECQGQKQDQKTYASCTIRNTPSLPIHCIVWGKHLFAQLFGEVDPDNDVSPDMTDKEINPASTVSNKNENDVPIVNYSSHHENGENGNRQISTREWAQVNDYNANKLFQKLFNEDINYLLKMDKLWEKRRKPTPLTIDKLENLVPSSSSKSCSNGETALEDQRIWSLRECYDVFDKSITVLKSRLEKENNLVWDKDDECALNFVTAVSNLRSHCFGIEIKSKFDVKSMAGNIIPAISSTNSVVGGLIVLQAMKILKLTLLENENKADEKEEETRKVYRDTCKHIYLRKVSLAAKNLIASYDLNEPNEQCFVCSGQIPEFDVKLNLNETLMIDFVEQILNKKLNFVCPDILIDGTPIILWSKEDSEEWTSEEEESYRKKRLIDYPYIENDVRLRINDLLQDNTMIITLKNEQVDINENEGVFFKLILVNEGNSKEKEVNTNDKVEKNENNIANINEMENKRNDVKVNKIDEADIICIVDEDESDVENLATPKTGKKQRIDSEPITIEDDDDDEEQVEDNDQRNSNDVNSTINSEDSVEFLKAEINVIEHTKDVAIEDDVIEIETRKRVVENEEEIFSPKKKKLSDER